MYEHLICNLNFIVKIPPMRYKYSLSLSILQYYKRNMTEIIFKISLLYYNRHVKQILLQYRMYQCSLCKKVGKDQWGNK